MVDPAAGELQHRADSVIRRSVDSLGSAGGQRSLQLFPAAVDRDDLPRSGKPGGCHHLEADSAAADDAYGVAEADSGNVADRADSGDDGASDQRSLPERKRARHPERRCGWHHAMLGKTRNEQEMLEGPAIAQA